jgi:hypothetical protein
MIASDEGGALRWGQLEVPAGPGVVGGRLHLAQQGFEVGRPRLLILLLQEGELAQVMHLAQRMTTLRVHAVAAPAVMQTHAREVRQDADGSGSFVPTPGVDGVVREPTRARHLRPRQSPASADAGLVVMHHRRLAQRRLDLLLHRLQDPRRLRNPT